MRSSDIGINNNARYDFKQLVCNMNIDGTDYEFTIQYEIDLQLNILKDYNSEIKITLDLRTFNYLNLFLPINSGVDTDIEHLTYTYFISTILKSNKDEIIELLNKGVGISLDRISYEIVKDAFHVISSGTLATNHFEVIHDDFNANNIENSNLITYIEDEDKIIFTSVI